MRSCYRATWWFRDGLGAVAVGPTGCFGRFGTYWVSGVVSNRLSWIKLVDSLRAGNNPKWRFRLWIGAWFG